MNYDHLSGDVNTTTRAFIIDSLIVFEKQNLANNLPACAADKKNRKQFR